MSGLRVTEIFHSIQGESSWAGFPCVFIRLTGCPLRCRWCDTAYAFTGGTTLSIDEVLAKLRGFGSSLVEVTGGEPLAQSASLPLLSRLCDEGYTVLLETSGSLPIQEVDRRVRIIMDLKCPDSGEEARNRWENLDHLKPGDEVKFVISGRRDYEWARQVVREHGQVARSSPLFSPVWGEVDFADLARWILEDRLAVRLQVQMHKILFGADVRGV